MEPPQEFPEPCSNVCGIKHGHVQQQEWFLLLLHDLEGFQGTAMHLTGEQDNRGIAVPHIGSGPFTVRGGWKLFQRVPGINDPVLGLPAGRAPSPAGDPMIQAEIEDSPVNACLASRYELQLIQIN